MEYPTMISVTAAIISLISALISARNLRMSEEKFQMDAFKWQRDYFSEMGKWADSCLDNLSEATHLCDVDPGRSVDFYKTRLSLMSKISALIDRGRFFFPNYEADYGNKKLPSNQGYRHEVLDALVLTYRLLKRLDYSAHTPNHELRDQFVEQKRLFTYHIQRIVNPRGRQAEYMRILTSLPEKPPAHRGF